MVSVENNSEKHSHVSSTQQKNQKVKIVLTHLQKCKIVSGISSISGVDLRAHPELYKPLDELDDDELDDGSADAPETATKKGDGKLNNDNNGANHASISTENGKAKQGDDKKNESQVARSG